jgi:hypothetical protein
MRPVETNKYSFIKPEDGGRIFDRNVGELFAKFHVVTLQKKIFFTGATTKKEKKFSGEGGVPVPTAWRVLGLRIEERAPAMEVSCEYIE